MTYYVGIADGSGDVWGVRFPDFPGCHGGGATPEAAVEDATHALRAFVADVLADGEAIPAPRQLDAVAATCGASEAAVLVPLLIDKARPVRANISLDAGLLELIDSEANRRGLTRSAFLASAARDKIASAG